MDAGRLFFCVAPLGRICNPTALNMRNYEMPLGVRHDEVRSGMTRNFLRLSILSY